MTTPSHPTLVDAIENRLSVTFRYHSENSSEEEPTDRVVEPWIYGCKNGKESLYGYQLAGGEPGMRRFDMRRVKVVKLTGDHIENHPTDGHDVTKWESIFASTGKAKDLPRVVSNPADSIAA